MPTQAAMRSAVKTNEKPAFQILVLVKTPIFSQAMSFGSGALSKTYFILDGMQKGKKVRRINLIIGKELFA